MTHSGTFSTYFTLKLEQGLFFVDELPESQEGIMENVSALIFWSVNIYLLPGWSGLGEDSKRENLWVLRPWVQKTDVKQKVHVVSFVKCDKRIVHVSGFIYLDEQVASETELD